MRWVRTASISFLAVGIALLAVATPAMAQTPPFDLKALDGLTSARMVEIAVALTLLSLAPGLLMMVTCFTRFVIAFSFLRVGLGLPSTPGNIVLISLALFMTMFVMGPTFEEAWNQGVKPRLNNTISDEQAYQATTKPFREFMQKHVRQSDLQMFQAMASERFGSGAAKNDDLTVLIPAFMVSELRRGFEIGFLIILPFLVIDMIVATIVMAMGMMMLPPTTFSLPMKVLFFVLIDGWGLLVNGLVRSVG